MFGAQRAERIRDRPRLQRALGVIRAGDDLEGGLANLVRACALGPVRVNSEVPRHREQPRPGRPVGDGFRVLPGAQECLLHDVLCALPVAAHQVHRVSEQRRCMLSVERTDQVLVGWCPRVPGSGASEACHAH